jgi:hypothetical protein
VTRLVSAACAASDAAGATARSAAPIACGSCHDGGTCGCGARPSVEGRTADRMADGGARNQCSDSPDLDITPVAPNTRAHRLHKVVICALRASC